MDQTERTALGDVFDRTIRSLNGLPDVLTTKATTERALSKVLELAQTFMIQTYWQKEAGAHVRSEPFLTRLRGRSAVGSFFCRFDIVVAMLPLLSNPKRNGRGH